MTAHSPLVSIILPTYNRERVLQKAVESILLQTFQNFELIIVDDGSTDNTEKMIRQTFEDGRIKFHRYLPNQGATHARNVGINHAVGQFIAFQDSDDVWTPDKLMKQVTVIQSAPDDIGAVYTAYYRDENGKMTYMPAEKTGRSIASKAVSRLFYLFVATPTVLLKKECLENVGSFDESLPRLQEWELWIRLSEHCGFQYIDEPLVVSRYQPDSITANQPALVRAFESILAKHRTILERDRQSMADLFAIFGRHLLVAQETFSKGRSYLLTAAGLKPMKVKYILLVLFSSLGYRQSDNIRKVYRYLRFRNRNNS